MAARRQARIVRLARSVVELIHSASENPCRLHTLNKTRTWTDREPSLKHAIHNASNFCMNRKRQGRHGCPLPTSTVLAHARSADQ